MQATCTAVHWLPEPFTRLALGPAAMVRRIPSSVCVCVCVKLSGGERSARNNAILGRAQSPSTTSRHPSMSPHPLTVAARIERGAGARARVSVRSASGRRENIPVHIGAGPGTLAPFRALSQCYRNRKFALPSPVCCRLIKFQKSATSSSAPGTWGPNRRFEARRRILTKRTVPPHEAERHVLYKKGYSGHIVHMMHNRHPSLVSASVIHGRTVVFMYVKQRLPGSNRSVSGREGGRWTDAKQSRV